MKTVKNVIALAVMSVFLIPAFSQDANAVPVNYDLNGGVLFSFNGAQPGAGAAQFQYVFGLGTDFANGLENLALTTDAALGTASVTASLTGAVVAHGDVFTPLLDGNGDARTVNVDLTFNYTGLNFGTDPITGEPIILVGRETTAGGNGRAEFVENFPGAGVLALDFNLEDKFNDTGNAATYGVFSNAPFNVILGQLLPGGGDVFKAWVMSAQPVVVGGLLFNVTGDISANANAQVPEPATAALLGMALVGGALRRKKEKLVA